MRISLRYSLVFLTLAVWLALSAVRHSASHPALAAGLLYLALSVVFIAIAYGGAGASIFRKRADGSLPPLTWFAFGPYFLLNALSFRLYCLTSREPAYVQVAENLYLGRRLTNREIRKADPLQWRGVVDLTCEFPEARAFRTVVPYYPVPTLDTLPPSAEQLHAAVQWIQAAVADGPVYVHCALGHGRSATVVLAYLLVEGDMATIDEGLAYLQSLRPGVRLTSDQVDMLTHYVVHQERQAVNDPSAVARSRG